LAILVFVLTFLALMTLIAGLFRPQEAFLTVNQQAMIDLRAMMNNSP
jgi:ABC-type molybdate transport system ATPase subunit